MKELLDICRALKAIGDEPCALATVVQVEGSAYRRPGARMLIPAEGESWGMISGGCFEHDVVAYAHQSLQSHRPRCVRYDSTSNDDIIFGTGLGCNGVIDVLVEPVTESFRISFIQVVEDCLEKRQPGAIATLMPNGTNLAHERAFFMDASWSGDQEIS